MKNNIQEIIDKLIPLYNTGNEDLPDQPLWHNPDISNICLLYTSDAADE